MIDWSIAFRFVGGFFIGAGLAVLWHRREIELSQKLALARECMREAMRGRDEAQRHALAMHEAGFRAGVEATIEAVNGAGGCDCPACVRREMVN